MEGHSLKSKTQYNVMIQFYIDIQCTLSNIYELVHFPHMKRTNSLVNCNKRDSVIFTEILNQIKCIDVKTCFTIHHILGPPKFMIICALQYVRQTLLGLTFWSKDEEVTETITKQNS